MTVMPIVQKSLIAADGGEQTPVPGPRDGTLNLKKCANKADLVFPISLMKVKSYR